MSWLAQAFGWMDAVLIYPYRLPGSAIGGFWLGTAMLAVWASLVGHATYRLARRVNHKYLDQKNAAMTSAQNSSFNALRAGDKKAYQGINRLASEAFGQAFFMNVALSAASLWPAALAAAWMQQRFAALSVPLPLVGWPLNYLAVFILCYVPMRLLTGRLLSWAEEGAKAAK